MVCGGFVCNGDNNFFEMCFCSFYRCNMLDFFLFYVFFLFVFDGVVCRRLLFFGENRKNKRIFLENVCLVCKGWIYELMEVMKDCLVFVGVGRLLVFCGLLCYWVYLWSLFWLFGWFLCLLCCYWCRVFCFFGDVVGVVFFLYFGDLVWFVLYFFFW